MQNSLVIAGIALLAAGTYAIRFAGYRLGSRMHMSERVRNMLSDAATVLLLAVAVTTALFEGTDFAGVARLTGVLFAVFLAASRAIDTGNHRCGCDDGAAALFWRAVSGGETTGAKMTAHWHLLCSYD